MSENTVLLKLSAHDVHKLYIYVSLSCSLKPFHESTSRSEMLLVREWSDPESGGQTLAYQAL